MKSALFTILILVLIPSVLSAECDAFDAFNYSYTNNDDVAHRVTFVLMNKSTDDMLVIFEPRVLNVLPGEQETFSATARSDGSIEGVQSALFAIRKGTDIVAYATAYFELSCPQEEPERPIWRDVLFYTSIVLIAIILILSLVLWLLSRDPREPREQKTIPESVGRDTPLREARAPINVDAMIRAERERSEGTPWWLWVLVALVALLVIGAFLYLVFSGANVEGFNYGAGINVTNLANLTDFTNLSG